MTETIAFQPEFSHPEVKVINNKEYSEYKFVIDRIDGILKQTGGDLDFARDYINNVRQRGKDAGITRELTSKRIAFLTRHAIIAYRCIILRHLLQKSYRELSILIAGAALLRNFCQIQQFNDEVRVPSKSSLNRFNKLFTEDFLRDQVVKLTRQATDSKNILGLKSVLTTEDVFVDATCLEANIHFPVDWVLLKDCMMTILFAILTIRKHGLKYRIKEPKSFISEINALCMTMTSHSGKVGAKKMRKQTYRAMRRIAERIRKHGCRYSDLLEAEWQSKTDLKEGEKDCIKDRILRMLELLPQAIEQADTRILHEKLVDNQDKILSVYHDDINIIKRGKAGGKYEFGNTLFLAEQNDGLILDWKLYRTDVKEPQATPESVTRMTESYEFDIKSLTGDRGCQSEKNDKFLKDKKIYSGLCPRSPLELAEKMQEPKFRKLQKRRAQTEGRIGIVKNNFLSGELCERAFDDKEVTVAWAVLTHNLWLIARLPQAEELQKTG